LPHVRGAASLTILVAALTCGASALTILVAALTCGAAALTSFVAPLTCGATALTSFVALQVEYTELRSFSAARVGNLSAARGNVRVTMREFGHFSPLSLCPFVSLSLFSLRALVPTCLRA